MRTLLAAAAVCLLVAADNPSDEAKKDLAALQGEWSMTSGERDGQPIPDDLRKGFKRVVKDDVTTITASGQTVMKARFTVDPAKKPKAIDYTLLDGPNKDKKVLGIYELDGDTVKFCFAAPDQERPKEFKGDAGRTFSAWKRDKK
jgi:uncharacterized protein (TIGR03067 family)